MDKTSTLTFILAILFLYLENSLCDGTERTFKTVEVKIQQGVLSGKVEKSFLNDKDYYAFRSIPYAEPPLEKLRFQPPKPHAEWDGTYEAYTNKPTCLQFCSRERNGEPFGLSGSEDCLYLSVYTPALEGNYPVVVFDYNDNFKTGFNGTDTYSPDFFIEEDVVVVTITHRLGVLGYLTTEDQIIPGNNGLRDFILGLNWVKNNIEKFGGDANRVTLMGSKGGAVMAEILLRSEKAKGLFSAVIMQSGTALETPYFYKNPRAKAFELGKELEIETNDSKLLLDELQKVDAEKLVLNEHKVHDQDSLIVNHMIVMVFVPTVEKENHNAIITSLPDNAKIVNDVPVVIGLTSREGLDLAQHFIFNPKILQDSMSGVTMNLPIRTNFRFDRDSLIYNRDASKEVNEVYYKDGYLHASNILEYAAYLGDVLHGYAIDKAAKTLAKHLKSKVFYYMFDFRGLLNENMETLSRYSRFNIQQWGATVTDDLCYLHLCTRKRKTYEELNNLISQQIEFKILKKMVKLWTNFIKTRNPVLSEEDNIIRGIKWEAMSADDQEAKYLHISNKITMKKEPLGHRAKFWDEFLDKYSKKAVDGVVTDDEGQVYDPIPLENMRSESQRQTFNQKDVQGGVENIEDEVTKPVNVIETEYGNVFVIENAGTTNNDLNTETKPSESYGETRDEL